MADLSVDYAGLKLKNPLICASGPATDTVEGCKAAARNGFAAIVLKSIFHRGTGELRNQHAVPRFKAVDRFRPYERWTPAKGLDNVTVVAAGEAGSVRTEANYADFVNEVKKAVGDEVKIGASVVGPRQDPDGYEEYLDLFKNTRADFLELDLGYVRYYKRVDVAVEVVKRAKRKLSIPVTLKMAPFLTDPVEIALLFQDAGVDGITMFDIAWGIDFDINGMKFPIWNTVSYLAPGVTLPYTNACIESARTNGITTSISASFGPWYWEDVIKCIMCGADAVQLCRKVMVQGYQVASSFLKSVKTYTRKQKKCARSCG